jgi:hypothetical protein
LVTNLLIEVPVNEMKGNPVNNNTGQKLKTRTELRKPDHPLPKTLMKGI